MNLSVGIVGLPNVGKSTTFNALVKANNAASANYPFCTIEPNKAIALVPDPRLAQLAKIVNPSRILPSSIEFVDIAGLVKNAHQGEGLGNKFLSHIREVEVILHIVRCFDDENISHVENEVDPIRDVEIIETELILADIDQLSKKIEKLTKEAKANQKGAKESLECARELMEHLNSFKSARSFSEFDNEIFKSLNKELRLLSAKELIYGANVNEDSLGQDNEYVKKLRQYAGASEVIRFCSKIEEDLIGMAEDEARELLAELGGGSSALDKLIKTAFSKLNLINYFTAGTLEVRSWTIKKGQKAPEAAGVIHNDFQKGFIRAEVIKYEDFIANNGEAGAKEAGKMRLEGKDYVVNDGDVMHFRFNV